MFRLQDGYLSNSAENLRRGNSYRSYTQDAPSLQSSQPSKAKDAISTLHESEMRSSDIEVSLRNLWQDLLKRREALMQTAPSKSPPTFMTRSDLENFAEETANLRGLLAEVVLLTPNPWPSSPLRQLLSEISSTLKRRSEKLAQHLAKT